MSEKNLPRVLIRVLIVEKDLVWLSDFLWMLENENIELVPAYSISQAKNYAMKYSGQLSAISMGINCECDIAELAELARIFRTAFPHLPIIVMGDRPSFRDPLLKAGCNYACEKRKFDKKLLEILNLPKD